MSCHHDNMESNLKSVTLLTNDEVSFTVDPNVLKFSNVLYEMITILTEHGDSEDDRVPIRLEHINKIQMEKVIEWCTHYQNDTPMGDELDRVKNIHGLPEWDRQFFRVDNKTLMSLARAANFLDIKPMMNMICKIIALQIRGNTVSAVLDMFDLPKKRLQDNKNLNGNEIIGDLPSLNSMIQIQEPRKNNARLSKYLANLKVNPYRGNRSTDD